MKSACGGKIVRGEMMRGYRCSGEKKGPYFGGWYLKYQTREGEALALIPAFHIDGEGRRSASLQVLADGGSWWLEYPAGEFQASAAPFQVRVGQNIFSDSGAVIRQGKYRLAAELLEGRGQPLRAPAQGAMGRTIHESLRSSMRFRLWQGERLLLDHTDSWASFEYAAE